MDKAEIMSLLGHEGRAWGVRGGNVTTTIPFSDGKWISLLNFFGLITLKGQEEFSYESILSCGRYFAAGS